MSCLSTLLLRPAAALCLALWLGAALPGQAAQTAAPVALTVWMHSGPGPEREALEASVRAFQQARPHIRLTLVGQEEGGYQAALTAAAERGALPCLLDLDGPNLPYWVARGALRPLDDLLDRAAYQRRLLRTLQAQGQVDGKLYALGQYDSGLALWGHRGWLQKIGARIPASGLEPWSGEEFEQVLAALKKAGARQPLDMKFDYGVGEWLTYAFLPLVQAQGGDLLALRGGRLQARGALDSPASVQAFKRFQHWVRQGWVDASGQGGRDFVEGRAGLSYVGHWTYREYQKALGADLVLLPMPRLGPGRPVTGAGSWAWAVSASCPHPQEAAQVLEHLMSPAEVLRVTRINGAIPGTLEAIFASETYGAQGPLRLYVDQILDRKARLRPVTPAYPVVSAEFAQAVRQLADGADAERTLQAAAARIDTLLEAPPPKPVPLPAAVTTAAAATPAR
ncbi:ABC transporter substrate-binding protein [Ideonella livida]|uniref:Sugar ABC transporter substrate-binding protein n=1 Tax=Ideonella livida TaxID=2707176 RepID=A0A7C9PI70_9BURK|nr:sugar ABC transporter substrate-binding protein [Ideonella livida]NDY91851.1 sugar ABC transporter substrate-binding protein [Ideonella livida]